MPRARESIRGEGPSFRRRFRHVKIVGIVLIILGVLALVYQGIHYTTREKILDIGSIKITADEKRTIPLPPIVGGVALVAGIVMVVLDRKKTS
jgi:uncharacterized membrane protein HdeD (DUF308 family)